MKNKRIKIILVVLIILNLVLSGKIIFSYKPREVELSELKGKIEDLTQENEQLKQQNEILQSSLDGVIQDSKMPDELKRDTAFYQEKQGSEQLDNALLSWYFRRNSNHQTPEINSLYQNYLKNNGYCLGKTDEKTVYLTFDNGYENGYTSKVLDILQENNVKAAFFVTGSYIKQNPELVKRIVNEGHVLGNHTDTHPSLPKITDEKIQEEIKVVEQRVEQLTGYKTKYLRPPAGEFSQRTLVLTKQMGYKTIFWSMAYKDWVVDEQPGKQYAHKHVLDNVHNGAIILLHTVSQSNTEALDNILKDLKKQGYRFASLDELV